MSGKGQKVFSRPITEYLDVEREVEGNDKNGHGAVYETNSAIPLQAIRQIIAQEVGKIETEFNTFKEEVCKSLCTLEQRFN